MGVSDSTAGAISQAVDDYGDSSIEALKQINLELKKENCRLVELKESRSALISHIAHELRTPLTSILGFSEILLSQEELTAPQRNFCERIQNSAHQLQRTLNQLADLARMDITPIDQPSTESED